MIEKITLDNFKSHAHTEIELGRVTALVGPNGCGKTSVLQAIHLLSQLVIKPWGELRKGLANPIFFTSVGTGHSHISLQGREFGDPHLNWYVAVGFARNDLSSTSYDISPEHWDLISFKLEHRVLNDGQKVPPNKSLISLLDGIQASALKSIAYYKADYEKLAQPSYDDALRPQIGADGSNLASTIASIIGESYEAHQQIVDRLKELVPHVLAVRFRPAKVTRKETRVISLEGRQFPLPDDRELTGQELIFDTIKAQGLPARVMSDGTLLALGILTRFYTSPDNATLLFDDIEHGLHPLAQRRLIKILRELAEKHNKQILLTTHSPYIIDELAAKDVWVMATDKDGISHCQQLSKGPNAEFALKVLTTGEFLGAEGEDWVLDQPPQPVQQEPAHA